jgi:hypothetical protein
MLQGRPTTSTGTALLTVLPLPSSPNTLWPQHLTPPPLESAHAWVTRWRMTWWPRGSAPRP